ARPSCRQKPFPSLRKRCSAATLEKHKRDAELSLVVTQHAPGGAIRNTAIRYGCRERRGRSNRIQQWQKALIERLRGLAFERPKTDGWNDAHYAILCM